MGKYALLALLAAALAWKYFSGPGELGRIEKGDGFISAETQSTYFEFDLTGQRESGVYRLIALAPTAGMLRQMGFALSASLLRAEDYADFESIRAEGRCPASFLNGHAKNMLLAFSDPSAAAALEKAKADTGSQLELNGAVLRFAMGEIKGVKLGSFNLGNGTALLVDKAVIEAQ